MDQNERLRYLYDELEKDTDPVYMNYMKSHGFSEKEILRGMMNIRRPEEYPSEFLKIQDEYLKKEIRNKGITEIAELIPVYTDKTGKSVFIWKGDITTIRADSIVNAANKYMEGCFIPCHRCIDNAIHSFSGVQLRLECSRIMNGEEEETGKAIITGAYNLPSEYIIHTVGPVYPEHTEDAAEELLRSSYRSCLEKAEEKGLESIVFPCISTGEFRFPNDLAAKIAKDEVMKFLEGSQNVRKVIFNVFKDEDEHIYRELFR